MKKLHYLHSGICAFLLSGMLLSFGMADEKALQKQINDLEDRLDEVETKAELSKVKFGLDFNTSLNNFMTNQNNTTRFENARLMLGVYLNMNATIGKYAKFTGRLSMTKAFGDLDLGYPLAGSIGTLDAGRGVAGGAAIYVERAYVDIFMGSKFALTLGRLPATDGPGANLRNGSARMSTYPALAVNALGDGGVLTYKPYSNAALRVGYSKVYQPLALNSDYAGGNIFGTAGVKDANLYFAAFETPFLPKSFGTNLFMLTYVNLSNYSAPKVQVSSTQTIPAQDVGNMNYINLHLENEKMLGSGFNWFISASYYIGTDGKTSTLAATQAANGDTAAIQTLLQSPFTRFANENAFAIHAGGRYDIGRHFKLGYEYFHGSKYWYAFSRVSINDPLNFRQTRGNVHDVYAIWQIDLYQFFRLSYTAQIRNFEAAELPAVTRATDQTTHNIALAYLLRF